MIPKDKKYKLIQIYCHVCDKYEKELQYTSLRFSNNKQPEFTDQEIMTIFLFAVSQEKRFQVRQIYQFANDYLLSWFPKLPSYTAFNNRLNRLAEAFRLLSQSLIQEQKPSECSEQISLLDSLPIVTCSGKRTGKVATEFTDKGFCSTKSMYFYGMRLHALGFQRKNKMPFPEELMISPASENDLNVFRNCWSNISNRTFFGDKIYHNVEYFNALAETHNSIMLTPVKAVKGQSEIEKQFNKAADDLFSKAVSTVRQPIESFFNWLIQATDFQRASKVRSAKGLLIHVFGKIAAAFIYLIFNP
jgi:hypothetical protein